MRRIAGRRCEHAVEYDPVFVEQVRVAKEFGEFLAHFRIGRRAQEAQHDPAAGRDLQIEGARADERRAEPRHGIAQDDPVLAVFDFRHDGAFGCLPRPIGKSSFMVNFVLIRL